MSDYRNEVLVDLKKNACKIKGLKLPDQKRISFSEYDKKSITIRMRASAVTANMQTDVAVFEAWALALYCWLGVARVKLEWDALPPVHSAGRGHYNRFLFRVQNFAKWFPWFHVFPGPNEEEVAQWKMCCPNPLFLNRPSRSRDCRWDKPPDDASENEFERYFKSPAGKEELCRVLGWKRDCVLERQIPVGLFSSDPPKESNTFFSRGKSAMDLCAVDGAVVHVIELKKYKAPPKMGALAEALLYAAVVRGVQSGRIRFAQENPDTGDSISKRLPSTCRVEAHILAPRLHPLLDCRNVFTVLNAGLAKDAIGVGYIELESNCRITSKHKSGYTRSQG
jgi:hypothetical protein